MPEARTEGTADVASRDVARAVWGFLLIWTGAALFLRWGWGIGLVGAGAILLAAQAYRSHVGLKVDGFGFVVGVLLVACGVWNMLDVAVDLVPLVCIGVGVALLVSTWTARRARRGLQGPPDLHAPSHPRA